MKIGPANSFDAALQHRLTLGAACGVAEAERAASPRAAQTELRLAVSPTDAEGWRIGRAEGPDASRPEAARIGDLPPVEDDPKRGGAHAGVYGPTGAVRGALPGPAMAQLLLGGSVPRPGALIDVIA